MAQEDKELLLKDLCARLPYGVKVEVDQDRLQNYDNFWNNWDFNENPQEIDGVNVYGVTFDCMDMSDGTIPFEFIKPYLFPLSSMTEEQKEEYYQLQARVIYNSKGPINADVINYINWCCKNHIDVNGLIPLGLDNDATGLNIY